MALIPISLEAHAKTRIRPLSSYSFAARQPLIPICSNEIVRFCHEIPVVFAADGSNFTLAALAGLNADRNILIDDTGRWHGSYVPVVWRRGPFRLASIAGSEEGRLVLCLDDSSEQVNEAEGQNLFDETGAPTALIKDASSILGRLEADLRHTKELCNTLDAMGLLTPWTLDIEQPAGDKIKLKGLFRVDEPKIAQLTGDQLVTLRDMGGLVTIYAHLLSLSKIGILTRITQQIAAREQQREAVKSNKLDLDRAFGIIEDDPFIF